MGQRQILQRHKRQQVKVDLPSNPSSPMARQVIGPSGTARARNSCLRATRFNVGKFGRGWTSGKTAHRRKKPFSSSGHPALEKQRLPGPLQKTWAGTSLNSTPAMQETQPLFARPQPAERLTVRSSTTRMPPRLAPSYCSMKLITSLAACVKSVKNALRKP